MTNTFHMSEEMYHNDSDDFVQMQMRELLRQQVQWRERQIREHFADTPLALRTIERTGILPWDIELQIRTERPEFDEVHEDAYSIRVNEFLRVVEHPRGAR